jgi:hypothetical protein
METLHEEGLYSQDLTFRTENFHSKQKVQELYQSRLADAFVEVDCVPQSEPSYILLISEALSIRPIVV